MHYPLTKNKIRPGLNKAYLCPVFLMLLPPPLHPIKNIAALNVNVDTTVHNTPHQCTLHIS